jgi:tRNA(fMet)-specific endonuclease VapC
MRNARHWTNDLFAGTNAAIALLKEHPRMLHHVRRVGRSALRICAPVEAELWFGVAKSAKQEQNRSCLLTLLEWIPSLPFSGQATRHFGDIRAYLASQGTPIGPYDLQISYRRCSRLDACLS